MNKENLILKVLFVILIIVFMVIGIKKYSDYKKQSIITQDAFVKLRIAETDIPLVKGIKSYSESIDCSSLEENKQFVFYEFNKDFEDAKVSVNSLYFKDDLLLKDNIKDASNVNVLISVVYEGYEQNYIVRLTCNID